MEILTVDSCRSTNSEINLYPDAPHGFALATRCQTAGRGQRGNHWEAEPGKNLTFSVLLRPEALEARRQFEISMLVALAVAGSLDDLFRRAGSPYRAAVKWPNDIYVGVRKICGILIENSISGGRLERSVAGIGININQRVFLSDAPNPVSVAQLTGEDLPLDEVLRQVVERIVEAVDHYLSEPDTYALLERYKAALYPGIAVPARFAEPGGTPFVASVTDIEPDGHLVLSNGKRYAFKEISLILPDQL